jgi:hypothetical protein
MTKEPKNFGEKGATALKWGIILGIVILANVFLTYLVRVVYHEPEYSDFCVEKQVVEPIVNREACVAAGGQWTEPDPSEPIPAGMESRVGYCNEHYTCAQEYDDARARYNRDLFLVFTAVGALLLLGSAFISGASVVSTGVSLSGVLALIIGSVRYWSDMDDLLRVGVSGVALVALIALAWKKFKDI